MPTTATTNAAEAAPLQAMDEVFVQGGRGRADTMNAIDAIDAFDETAMVSAGDRHPHSIAAVRKGVA